MSLRSRRRNPEISARLNSTVPIVEYIENNQERKMYGEFPYKFIIQGDIMCFICERINLIKKGENPYFVKELNSGYVVIGDYQYFNGYALFLAKEHLTEIFELPMDARLEFLREMSIVAEAVSKAFGADKMNYELLGNADSHLHWHLFPRRKGDIDVPGPVWMLSKEIMFDDENKIGGKKLEEMVHKLRQKLEEIL